MIGSTVGGTERTLAAKWLCFKRTVVHRKQRDCEGTVESLCTEGCGSRTSGCTMMCVTIRSTYWEPDLRAGEDEGDEKHVQGEPYYIRSHKLLCLSLRGATWCPGRW
jgi:hypothetical protein